jgi:hypothetical protein
MFYQYDKYFSFQIYKLLEPFFIFQFFGLQKVKLFYPRTSDLKSVESQKNNQII